MNGPPSREFLSQLLIALAVCIGGWMMFVSPKAQKVHALEQEIADLEAAPESMDDASFRSLADRVTTMRSRLQAVADRSAIGRDSSMLYSRVMALAESHGVEVQRLTPGTDGGPHVDSAMQISRLQMSITGEYENVASFLGGLNDLGGYMRPESLSLSPAMLDGQSIMQANLTCSAMSFDVADVAKSLEDQASVDR